MNRMESIGPISLVTILLFTTASDSEGFIYFHDRPTNQLNLVNSNQSYSAGLLHSLEKITCLRLEIRNDYLRVKEPLPLPLIYASLSGRYLVENALHLDHRCSSTAKNLLLDSMRSSNVYKVRGNRKAALGRVSRDDFIELDFNDFGEIIYRDLPREVFDVGMIFLHELVHRHLKLSDPNKKEIEENSLVKGETVQFMNRIERELGLPERRHYAPIKIRYVRGKPSWGVYYGNGTDRIEIDQRFGLR